MTPILQMCKLRHREGRSDLAMASLPVSDRAGRKKKTQTLSCSPEPLWELTSPMGPSGVSVILSEMSLKLLGTGCWLGFRLAAERVLGLGAAEWMGVREGRYLLSWIKV